VVVHPLVFRIAEDLQIFKAVVLAVAVDVMHMLIT